MAKIKKYIYIYIYIYIKRERERRGLKAEQNHNRFQKWMHAYHPNNGKVTLACLKDIAISGYTTQYMPL